MKVKGFKTISEFDYSVKKKDLTNFFKEVRNKYIANSKEKIEKLLSRLKTGESIKIISLYFIDKIVTVSEIEYLKEK